MGMQDQYNDGRYDPRLDNPELNFVRAHPFTVQRGGIKYPTPTKETHMPERQTKAQIAHELKLNEGLLSSLMERRNQLKRDLQTAFPAEPPSYTMFTVSVRFKMRGSRYQFLILRSGKKYFTTGTKIEHRMFDSWEQLCEWLEGPDVYEHSNIEILQGAKKVVSFESGRIENEDPAGQAPF